MIFVRLEVHDEKGYESTPFCCCTKCHRTFYMYHPRFCPGCGHELVRKNKEPQIITVDKREDPSFNEWSCTDVDKFLKEKIDWNV